MQTVGADAATLFDLVLRCSGAAAIFVVTGCESDRCAQSIAPAWRRCFKHLPRIERFAALRTICMCDDRQHAHQTTVDVAHMTLATGRCAPAADGTAGITHFAGGLSSQLLLRGG